MDLKRLSQFGDLPNKQQWHELEEAEQKMGMSVCGDPSTCGSKGSKFTMTDMLHPIMGDAFAETPYDQRTKEEVISFSKWCSLLKWYMTLKRAGIVPRFEN